MSKRLFQILDEMNVADTENKTALLGVCSHFVGAQKAKGGGHVTMGVPEKSVIDFVLHNDEKTIPLLLLINRAEYERIKTEQ
jgi:hypothetical protein